jgi:transcriptional regulator with XRE-family HTH domain
MNGINFSKIIVQKRREKGITQEELANYMGVTKTSVSKWETGHTFPDITFLPVLAAYFDISIDCLMGYSPQMSQSDIKKLYTRLAKDFTDKPFEDVIAECEVIVKKYYSCYPLILKMAMLYTNHVIALEDVERKNQVLMESTRLCKRVVENSNDRFLVWGATNLQAMCYLQLNDGAKILETLGESLRKTTADGALIANAYLLLGNEEKAQETLQTDLFNNLMDTFGSLIVLLQNNLNCFEVAEPTYLRMEKLASLFNMKYLNANNVAIMYLFGAKMYQLAEHQDKSIEVLSKYQDVCINDFFPITIRGDNYFNKVDSIFDENDNVIPRSDAQIKKDMVNYLNNPIFEPLNDNFEFKKIVKKLENFAGIYSYAK